MENHLVAVRFGQEYKVLVDEDVFQEFSDYKWYVNSIGYVHNHTLGLLHRLILPTKKPLVVDHISREKLDNRRSNLRQVTVSQNAINAQARQTKKAKPSNFKGVIFDKHSTSKNKWRASTNKEGKKYYSKRVFTEKEAAISYNQLVLKHHGEFAVLNEV